MGLSSSKLVLSISNVVSSENGSLPKFDGQSVHILQIGIGTNKHFVDGRDHEIQTLLQGTTKQQNEPLTGIGVDPVEKWIEDLVQHCQALDKKWPSLLER